VSLRSHVDVVIPYQTNSVRDTAPDMDQLLHPPTHPRVYTYMGKSI
jgi:hypothetical protein